MKQTMSEMIIETHNYNNEKTSHFSNLVTNFKQMKKTALNSIHKQEGGKMVEFAGFEMP